MVKVKPRVPIPKRPVDERIRDFNEVVIGYDEKRAVEEANRCLQCPSKPCVKGCPIGVDIPRFIKFIRNREFEKAYKVLIEKCPIPAITGRVCPQEKQCEKECILAKLGQPIAIGALKRFISDWAQAQGLEKVNQKEKSRIQRRKKIAVVGSGPSGIVVAFDLARLGYEVTMFEALHKLGGVLVYGIPEFRLPKNIVDDELKCLEELGVEIKLGIVVGRTITLYQLLDEYDAIFIGAGAGHPRFLNIPGENLNDIYSANEFLMRVNLMKAYMFPIYDTPIHVGKRTAIIGAGNTAMDAARTAVRLGANEVYVLYRRTRREMPARLEEVINAEEEGVKFVFLVQPIKFIGSSKVESVKLMKMKLGELDHTGRLKPIPTGEVIEFPTDVVINAIGFHPNSSIPRTTPKLKTDNRGRIMTDQFGRTSIKRVYAGGDVVIGEGTVIEAMGQGRKVAKTIHLDLLRS